MLARSEPTRRRGRPAKNAPPRPGHERARRLKNPEDLTEHQSAKLAWIAKTDTRLYRAYLLKEGLRHVFSVKGQEGKDALDHGLSQGLIESTNTKIAVLTRIAFGFHNPAALIALAVPPSAATDPPYPAAANPPPGNLSGVSLPATSPILRHPPVGAHVVAPGRARGLHMDPSHAGSANEQLSRKGPQKRPTVTTPAAKTGPIDPRISQEGHFVPLFCLVLDRLRAVDRSRGQGAAPAAQRGRTTLRPTRIRRILGR